MRKDDNGDPCPSTLGEYLQLCKLIGGADCQAVKLLNTKIAEASNGENEEVLAPDSQMRFLLMPLLFETTQIAEDFRVMVRKVKEILP